MFRHCFPFFELKIQKKAHWIFTSTQKQYDRIFLTLEAVICAVAVTSIRAADLGSGPLVQVK